MPMASAFDTHQIYRMSRIPMRVKATSHTENHFNGSLSVGTEERLLKHKLSPLEKLREEYQEKLQIEKQEKILHLYEKRNDEALRKVRKYSSSRNVGTYAIGKKSNKAENSTTYLDSHEKQMAFSAQREMRIRKPQKLPPIDNVKKADSFHSVASAQNDAHLEKPHRVDGNYARRNNNTLITNGLDRLIEEDRHTSPPPNAQHLRLLRQRRLKQRQLTAENLDKLKTTDGKSEVSDYTFQSKRKMTDFEKWQQEQDTERMKRLSKHYSQKNTENDDYYLDPLSQSNHVALKKKKPDVKEFFSDQPTLPSKRSSSPISHKKSHSKRKEVLRQGIEKERRIAELEREIQQKQLDLKRMQERQGFTMLESSENENDSDIERQNTHAPISKPVKVSSKRLSGTNSRYSNFQEEDDVAFQMKPVIVRRDVSQGSSRGNHTPHKDKTYMVQNSQKKRKSPKNKPLVRSNGSIKEEKNSTKPAFQPDPFTLNQSSAYPIANILEEEENVDIRLVSCNYCGRKFASDRLEKHQVVCAKNQGKKRKVFDMTKARTQGTDAEKFVRRKAFKRSPSPPARKSNWRQKHEDFINTIRNAKQVSEYIAKGGKVSDLPPPPPSENPDYVKCQYCERRFNPTVAERHIPRCKDIKSRPKPPKRK